MNFSKIGFGCYRVDYRIDEHSKALKKALMDGITLIDTSANYSDGGSEILAGNVLDEIANEGKIKREDITLVTKVGYLQGQNYKFALKQKEHGHPFTDIVEYADGLWHCISPDFLDDQLKRQLYRLNQSYIDIYLLHNPEYYLGWAEKNNISTEAAHTEYYTRIKKAFEWLEQKVTEGKIKNYGISSNTFPVSSSAYNFTSLERILKIANEVSENNNFKFIQLPFNLFEIGALINKNQEEDTKTVLELAAEKNIYALINRPLNAITSKGLVRLAEFHFTPYTEKDFYKQIEKVKLMEDDMIKEKLVTYSIDEEEMTKLKKLFTFGKIIDENWKYFGSIEHFNDNVEHHFVPKINYLIEQFDTHYQNEDTLEFLKKLLNNIYIMLNLVSNHYKMKASKRSSFINKCINDLTDENFHKLTLSQKAIALINSIDGVSCVLVGARKDKYVDDIAHVLHYPPVENAKQIFLRLHEELMQAEYT